jgi:hypothetical protein
MTLAQHCKELEDMGKVGALDGAAAQFSLVQAEYERARAALAAI